MTGTPDAREDAIFIERLSLGGGGPAVAIKDTIDVAGTRTRAGSRTRDDVPAAERHADVVAALVAGGARIVGKTNLHEFAYGVTGVNAWTGTPRNARFPDRIPGGSSSGSAAAVAAGLAEFALGTDTGGSVRIPAACCGVFGLKPTFGRLSRRGVFPERSSLDCVGPFARSARGIERAMTLLDAAFTAAAAPRDASLGVVAVDAAPGVRAAFETALGEFGTRVSTVTFSAWQDAFDAGLAIIGAENWAALGRYVDSPWLGADVRDRLRSAREVTPTDVDRAEAVRTRFRAQVDAALEGVDALALPVMPVPPPTLDEVREGRGALGITAFVRPFNLSGHPAMSIPLPPVGGFSVGLQLVGRRGGDAELCALARAVEAACCGSQPSPT